LLPDSNLIRDLIKETDMAQKKLMTAKQIQKFLQISNNTLRAYVDKGLIGMWQPGGKNCTVRYYIIEEETNNGTA